jgi:hypothetical protein
LNKNNAKKKKHKKKIKEWKILTLMVCFISPLDYKKENTLLINQRKIKKNKEKQHTLRWEKKRMLDLR